MKNATASFSPRQRLLTTLRRQVPDRVPKSAELSPALLEVFQQETGFDDPAEYFGFEARKVSVEKPANIITDTNDRFEQFAPYLPQDLPAGSQCYEWGFARVPGDFYHFSKHAHPMSDFSEPRQVDEFPFPHFDTARFAALRPEVEAYHERGLAVIASMQMTIFELSWYLRGLENLLTDTIMNANLAAALLHRVTTIRCEMATAYAALGVDVLSLGDDVGTQRGMLMSPITWRQWLKPRLAQVIASARAIAPNILIEYHSDGAIEPIIPELIEIGVDVLNPVQPECMDPAALKALYGHRLAFSGTIGTQTVMPFGTPEEVRQAVRWSIEIMGANGGLYISPTHILEPDVPWENVLAFFDAVDEFGVYT